MKGCHSQSWSLAALLRVAGDAPESRVTPGTRIVRSGAPMGLALALALAAVGTAIGGEEAAKEERTSTLLEPKFQELRLASIAWQSRDGARREVVDVLCLVPDVPTFLEAIGTWDGRHYFPILLDDPELTLKFRRAFRPGRIVRYPRRAAAIPEEELWAKALAAVGKSWSLAPGKGQGGPGDERPEGHGPTPPGIVLSSPGSPSLAGAVALAAGRFQPLLRWEPGRKRADILTAKEAETLADDLEAKVSAVLPRYARLGDDCDFLTLAGDWPDRYQAVEGKAAQPGTAAFDDLIGRNQVPAQRWAFAGRLGGDPSASVYRAMCSLFLQPQSALLFNGYNVTGEPWAGYHMRDAARTLEAKRLDVLHLAGPEKATVAGWHKALDPVAGFGLALINTHGGPTVFNLQGGAAHTADVPWTDPTAVLMIHSFSAADPTDPSTIAGRWLANGAFLYFGSLNEPYLSAFRPPTAQADLIAEGLPFGAVARISAAESFPFAHPWRLHFLGDPLYRLRPSGWRVDSWAPVDPWPIAAPGATPLADAPAPARVEWAYRTLLSSVGEAERAATAKVLLAMRREGLPPEVRPRYDALLFDVLMELRKLDALRDRLGLISPADSTPDIRRWLETVRVMEFQSALAAGKLDRAAALWSELVRSRNTPAELKGIVTARVAARANEPSSRRAWLRVLLSTREQMGPKGSFDAELAKEIDRVRTALDPPK